MLTSQEHKQRNHTLTVECARLTEMARTLNQDLDQVHQHSQDAQSQAGAAHSATRRQAAQIATLTHTVEELRRAGEAAEVEKQELLVRIKQMAARRGQPAATDMEARQDTVVRARLPHAHAADRRPGGAAAPGAGPRSHGRAGSGAAGRHAAGRARRPAEEHGRHPGHAARGLQARVGAARRRGLGAAGRAAGGARGAPQHAGGARGCGVAG